MFKAVFDANIISKIFDILKADKTLKTTRTEAARVISNIADNFYSKHIEIIVNLDGLPILCDNLCDNDSSSTSTLNIAVLESILMILKKGEEEACNPYVLVLERCDRFKAIEDMRNVNNGVNGDVCEKANEIIERFFAKKT